MVDEQYIRDRVQAAFPGAQVHATDLTGGGDHWHVAVVAEGFSGQRALQRQRAIFALFDEEMKTERIHALDLKCLTPEELQTRHDGQVPEPFVPHQQGEGRHPGAWD